MKNVLLRTSAGSLGKPLADGVKKKRMKKPFTGGSNPLMVKGLTLEAYSKFRKVFYLGTIQM